MDGEYEFAQELVSRFTAYHRASYVCKTGLGDVMIGAASSVAEMNGAETASHVRDKLVEMTHLNETIYSSGIASSHEATEHESGAFINDPILPIFVSTTSHVFPMKSRASHRISPAVSWSLCPRKLILSTRP